MKRQIYLLIWVFNYTASAQSFPVHNANSDYVVAEGIRQCVCDIGEVLHRYFPYANDTDKNELPDDIVFGK